MSASGETPAVCHRCGADKRGPLVPCKACQYVPSKEARAVAWLFSAHHLSDDELQAAQARVRRGDIPDPARALRAEAQRAMGALDAPPEVDRPLEAHQVALLIVGEVILTPLVGLAVWLGLRETRPRAARLTWQLTVPITALFALMWLVDRWDLLR